MLFIGATLTIVGFLILPAPSLQQDVCLLGSRSVSLGETVHRLLDREERVVAADICFVVSMRRTMSHRWVQNIASKLDNLLMQNGIGNSSSECNRNRFCLIQFGGRTHDIRAKFIKVNDRIFFNSTTEARLARSMLNKHGFVSDGYEALEFALKIPFRTGDNVSRSIILGTDTGRDILSDKIYLNHQYLSQKLREKKITLDVVVNFSVVFDGDENSTVLGLQSFGIASIAEGDRAKIVSKNIQVTYSHGSTIADYIKLAFETGGSAWLLKNLQGRTLPLLRNTAAAFVYTRPYLQSNACEACTCMNKSERGSTSLVCELPASQLGCTMCVSLSSEECSVALQRTGLNFAGDRLQIETSLISQANGSATIGFHSNRGDVSFKCSHVNSTWSSVRQCVSPTQYHNLTKGRHLFVIEGRSSDGLFAARSVDVVVQSLQAETSNPSMFINISRAILNDAGSFASVSFDATITTPFLSTNTSSKNTSIKFICSVGNSDFHFCKSPYNFSVNSLLMSLRIVGIEARVNGAIGVATEMMNFSSPYGVLKIITSDPVVRYDLLEIRFATTRPATCFCFGEGPVTTCPDFFQLNITKKPNINHIVIGCRTGVIVSHRTINFSIPKKRCCPKIHSINVTAVGPSVQLQVGAATGNCSNSVPYHYHINWGDGAIVSGTEPQISQSQLQISRTFSKTGLYVITTKLCSSTLTSLLSTCCDSINSTVVIHPS